MFANKTMTPTEIQNEIDSLIVQRDSMIRDRAMIPEPKSPDEIPGVLQKRLNIDSAVNKLNQKITELQLKLPKTPKPSWIKKYTSEILTATISGSAVAIIAAFIASRTEEPAAQPLPQINQQQPKPASKTSSCSCLIASAKSVELDTLRQFHRSFPLAKSLSAQR